MSKISIADIVTKSSVPSHLNPLMFQGWSLETIVLDVETNRVIGGYKEGGCIPMPKPF